jgi:hypothetical protein
MTKRAAAAATAAASSAASASFWRRRVPRTSCSQLTLTATKEQQSECKNASTSAAPTYIRLHPAICGYLRPRQWILLIILIRPNIEIALQKFCFKIRRNSFVFKEKCKEN